MTSDPDSGFTPLGFDGMPNFYEENKHVGEFSTLPDPVLMEQASLIEKWHDRPDIMPRARNASDRILKHMQFEREYRAGLFERAPDDLGQLDRLNLHKILGDGYDGQPR